LLVFTVTILLRIRSTATQALAFCCRPFRICCQVVSWRRPGGGLLLLLLPAADEAAHWSPAVLLLAQGLQQQAGFLVNPDKLLMQQHCCDIDGLAHGSRNSHLELDLQPSEAHTYMQGASFSVIHEHNGLIHARISGGNACGSSHSKLTQ
jgi:hypothetical protein